MVWDGMGLNPRQGCPIKTPEGTGGTGRSGKGIERCGEKTIRVLINMPKRPNGYNPPPLSPDLVYVDFTSVLPFNVGRMALCDLNVTRYKCLKFFFRLTTFTWCFMSPNADTTHTPCLFLTHS